MASDDRSSGFSLSGLGGFGGSGGVEITDDEGGGVIAGGSGSASSRKSWTNARRYSFGKFGLHLPNVWLNNFDALFLYLHRLSFLLVTFQILFQTSQRRKELKS